MSPNANKATIICPQIRVRVLYSNESHQLLPGKFGNHFETRVANHSEILLFKRNIVRHGCHMAIT